MNRDVHNNKSLGTFIDNKKKVVHGWYPYLEGYSADLVTEILDELDLDKSAIIYDPFAGSGTTAVVSNMRGYKSLYSETNPFMRTVIKDKTSTTKNVLENPSLLQMLREFKETISKMQPSQLTEVKIWDGFEKYFNPENLNWILGIKTEIKKIQDESVKDLAQLALSSILVRSSKMKRQGDLRFAKTGEKKDDDNNVKRNYINKLSEIISDLTELVHQHLTPEDSFCISEDAKEIDEIDLVDCIITSPPYLNGTNYIRNTKLELKLNDMITNEKDLPELHSKGIIAGINNVSKRNEQSSSNPYLESILSELSESAYDTRIPKMVSGYFNDMEQVIARLSKILKNNGYFYMDIGDSQFGGVYIPTHELLIAICKDHGFSLVEQIILRQRKSKNGMALSQRLLKFKLEKDVLEVDEELLRKAMNFVERLPYKEKPYSSRNWGNSLHSLCSYHGKLKPAIAFHLINSFSNKGDVVIDPFCGVGTIPLEACLQGRIGVGNDLSQLAYCVTKAKVELPHLDEVNVEINNLSQYILTNCDNERIDREIEKFKDFGFNGKVANYFHPKTFREILCARNFYKQKFNDLTPTECMVLSCLLHILHGNRPYALSRNSHPLTPYAPTGEFMYKPVIDHLKNKIDLAYRKIENTNFAKGKAILGDFVDLPSKLPEGMIADVIISSPPFADSIRFYMQNWMRLWFCGWEKSDFDSADEMYLDQKQKNNFDIYYSFFHMCSKILRPNGIVVLHLGKTSKIDMAKELSKRSLPWFQEIYSGCEDVSKIEKHGIKDKGNTTQHQFLFLKKK